MWSSNENPKMEQRIIFEMIFYMCRKEYIYKDPTHMQYIMKRCHICDNSATVNFIEHIFGLFA